MLRTLILFTFLLLFSYCDIIQQKRVCDDKSCGVLKAHFNNPTPAAFDANRTETFTYITITIDVVETAKVELVVSYYGQSGTTIPVRLILKDSLFTTIASTSEFTPVFGWNTIDFTSFTAKGSGKTLTIWITTGAGTGYIILHSGYLKYLQH